MSRGKLYFFNRFFWPDNSATAQILTDLVRELEGSFEVVVVTTRLNYGDPTISYPSRESFENATVRRLWSTRFGRASSLGRLMDYLSTYFSFFIFSLKHLRRGDVAVYKTDPPLLSVPGAVACRLKGFTMVSWCQDLFPEVAMSEIQFPRGTGWMLRIIRCVRNWSLRVSSRVIVLGRDMQHYLVADGIPENKLVAISNWSVQTESDAPGETSLRAEWEIPENCFVVGYSGNLGRAHDWRTVLEAARRLCGETDLIFLCCGGGYGYEQLKDAVANDEALSAMIRFLPYQPLERLSASLAVPDVHWFTLKEQLTPFIFPSKFFGILQAGKAVLFIGDPQSEIADLIRDHRLGAVVSEGDSEAFADAVMALRSDPEFVDGAASRARHLWKHNYQKEGEIRKWKTLMNDLFTH